MKKLSIIHFILGISLSTYAEDTCYVQVNGNTFVWNYTSAVDGTFVDYTIAQPGTDYGFTFDIYNLDNSFNMEINGVKIVSNEIQF